MYRLSIEAFVEDEATLGVVTDAMGDVTLFRSTMNAHRGGIEAAVSHYSSNPTPELVVVQTTGNAEQLLNQLERFSGVVGPGSQIMVIGTVDGIDFYRTLIDMNVGQYLLAPISRQSFLRGIRDVFGEEMSHERGRTIAVTGAKGGVGASTIAHNIAASLVALYKKPVTIVDADIHFGTAAMAHNHEPRFGMRDALTQAGRLDEGMMERMLSKEGENLWLLGSSPSLSDSMAMTPDAMDSVLDVIGKMSTFTVIDLPHGWNAVVGDIVLSADEVLIVSEPDLPSLSNTQKIFEAIGSARPHGTALRCVLNHVNLNKATELTAKDFEESLGVAPVASFAWDPQTFRVASLNGQMVRDLRAKSKAAGQFDALAQRVSGRWDGETVAKSSKPEGLLASLFGESRKSAKRDDSKETGKKKKA